jgi:hypothetical protein
MTPERKAAIEQRAASLGVSSGEYIRLAVDNYEKVSPHEEAELAALVGEVNETIPRMRESLDRMNARASALHEELDAFLREKGVRK